MYLQTNFPKLLAHENLIKAFNFLTKNIIGQILLCMGCIIKWGHNQRITRKADRFDHLFWNYFAAGLGFLFQRFTKDPDAKFRGQFLNQLWVAYALIEERK